MLNDKYISFGTIVAKLYRDLKITDEESFTDIIEWIAEALDFIHVYPQYNTGTVDCVPINNYKGELPCNYIAIEAIEYNGHNVKYSSDLRGAQIKQSDYPSDTPYSLNRKRIENAIFVDPSTMRYFDNGASVVINNGYIHTSFEKGNLNIIYTSMVVDEDGYPMIPDHQSFKEAIYWYCTYKILYPKVLNGEVNVRFYDDAFAKWNYYCNQAGAEALMPDLITLENLKRSFLSLKPSTNQFDNFFNRLNKN